MGLTITKLFDRFFGRKEMKILMLGLDAAGKTTILYKLKLGEIVSTVPTIGFNVETLHYKNVKFTVWDVCTQTKVRLLWHHYFQGVQGLIFVVDSSDKERIELAKEELYKLLGAEGLKDAVFLVFANKQDMGVMSVAEVTEKLELQTIKGKEIFVQGTCATTGDGLYEGLDWLSMHVSKKKKSP